MNPANFINKNLIIKHIAGSHSYGMATPESDMDIRGVFSADPVNILTPFFPIKEVSVEQEEDTKFYELTHFINLCVDCNPNIAETLWVDEEHILQSSDVYNFLRENREKFLSKKIAFTTTGYALAQLKRIKGHNKFINSPFKEKPKQTDYVSLVQNFTSKKMFKFNIYDYADGYRLYPYGDNLFGVFESPGYRLFNVEMYDLNIVINEDKFKLHRDDGSVVLPLFIVKFNKQEYKNTMDKYKAFCDWKANRNKKRSALEQKYGYDCYVDETEFLTSSGWKKYDDINRGDKLGTFCLQSHKLDFQEFNERFENQYTGNLYKFKGYHKECHVTANHNMVIRPYSKTYKTPISNQWKLVPASQVPESFHIINTLPEYKNNRQKFPDGFDQKVLEHIDIKNYLRLLGWYISDGTCSFNINGDIKNIKISQSKPQSRLTQNLNKQRNLNKIICSENIYDNITSTTNNYKEHVWIFPNTLSRFIYNDCGHGSKIKRIPSWVFELTTREKTLLLTALLQGDGTKRNHQDETYVYYTSNKLLADDVQLLCLLCGYETSIWGPYSYNESDCPMFHVHINKRPKKERLYSAHTNIEKEYVRNKRVVCFSVKNSTLITRLNGKISMHGNCKHASHLVRLCRMGEEALTTGQVIVNRPDAEELLAIRNGAWTYKEVVEYAEHADNYIRNVLYKKSELQKKPNKKEVASILMEAQYLVWSARKQMYGDRRWTI